MFEKIQEKLAVHFPKLEIKYKDQSTFMKLIAFFLFFNKSFMTQFTTTIGNTVYFPTEQFVRLRQLSSFILLMHELVHVHDSSKLPPLLFKFLYLFPQITIIFALLAFIFSWKLALPLIVLSLIPIPAYFRMNYERRAYLVSLYVMNNLNDRFKYNIDLNKQKTFFLSTFKNSSYYFMWPFKGLDAQFDAGLAKILNHERPYEDPIFDVLDDILVDYSDG